MAQQAEWYSIFLDCSKCFDNLRYADVEYFAERLGCPLCVLRPAMAWLRHHKRIFQIQKVLGPLVQPFRGVPQGCPLSVVWCCVWSASWAEKVRSMADSATGLPPRITIYLDDWSLGASDFHFTQTAMGIAQQHFNSWCLKLNLDKCAMLKNGIACNHHAYNIDIATPSNQVTLGHDVGWRPAAVKAEERCKDAQLRLERVRHLRLPKTLVLKVIMRMVSPLLFAIDAAPDCDEGVRLEKKMRLAAWGSSRPSTCWPAVLAYGLPPHVMSLTTRAFTDAAAILHDGVANEALREEVMYLWNLHFIP